jgi:hypothetical protein
VTWREFSIAVRLRGNVGDGRTATRRFTVYADSHEEAMTKAIEKARDLVTYEVKVRRP